MFDPKRAARVDVKRHRRREEVREMDHRLRHWRDEEPDEIFEESLNVELDNDDKVNVLCSINRGHLWALNKRW